MAKILIVDDEARIRELLRKALTKAGYEIVSVPSAEQSLELIFKEPFDLLLLDVRLSSGESGLSILKKVREHQKDVPIVIYTGALTPELEIEARTAGANEVLSKDIDILQLVAQIGKIVKVKDRILQGPLNPGEKSLLVVDDEEGILRVLKIFFTRKGYKVFEAESGEKALQIARSEKISAVLLDMKMPGMDGLATLEKLLEINPKLGVVMATGEQDDEKVKKAIVLGAYGYVLKPFDFLYLELVVASKLAIAESD
ncbi:MAG: response regulator [Candidatus Omnitrophica bacterium]|nr:response regulator [Candidatus Omnitrophota bacterium]